MTLNDIYREVEKVCKVHYRVLPRNSEAEIRQTLQSWCASSPQHNGRDHFFEWHERGYWSCKVHSPSLDRL